MRGAHSPRLRVITAAPARNTAKAPQRATAGTTASRATRLAAPAAATRAAPVARSIPRRAANGARCTNGTNIAAESPTAPRPRRRKPRSARTARRPVPRAPRSRPAGGRAGTHAPSTTAATRRARPRRRSPSGATRATVDGGAITVASPAPDRRHDQARTAAASRRPRRPPAAGRTGIPPHRRRRARTGGRHREAGAARGRAGRRGPGPRRARQRADAVALGERAGDRPRASIVASVARTSPTPSRATPKVGGDGPARGPVPVASPRATAVAATVAVSSVGRRRWVVTIRRRGWRRAGTTPPRPRRGSGRGPPPLRASRSGWPGRAGRRPCGRAARPSSSRSTTSASSGHGANASPASSIGATNSPARASHPASPRRAAAGAVEGTRRSARSVQADTARWSPWPVSPSGPKVSTVSGATSATIAASSSTVSVPGSAASAPSRWQRSAPRKRCSSGAEGRGEARHDLPRALGREPGGGPARGVVGAVLAAGGGDDDDPLPGGDGGGEHAAGEVELVVGVGPDPEHGAEGGDVGGVRTGRVSGRGGHRGLLGTGWEPPRLGGALSARVHGAVTDVARDRGTGQREGLLTVRGPLPRHDTPVPRPVVGVRGTVGGGVEQVRGVGVVEGRGAGRRGCAG